VKEKNLCFTEKSAPDTGTPIAFSLQLVENDFKIIPRSHSHWVKSSLLWYSSGAFKCLDFLHQLRIVIAALSIIVRLVSTEVDFGR
jgi:hypothetical protein